MADTGERYGAIGSNFRVVTCQTAKHGPTETAIDAGASVAGTATRGTVAQAPSAMQETTASADFARALTLLHPSGLLKASKPGNNDRLFPPRGSPGWKP